MLTKFVKSLRPWRPIKYDWYLFEEVIGTFFGACIFSLFILLMFQALRLMELLILHGASWILLAKIAFYLSLSLLSSVLPLSFLIAVLIAFGRLSSDSELIAMKASGMSMIRLSAPIFFFALIVAGVSTALNNQWVPRSQIAARKTEIKLGNTKAVSAIKEGAFTTGFFDLLLFADKVDPQTNRLYRVFIFDEREPKNPLTYVAREAEIVPVRTANEFGAAIMLRLYNGSMHRNNLEDHTYEKMEFDAYHLYLKIDEGKDTTMLKPGMIPQGDLIKKINAFPLATYEGKELRGEYWRRYTTAFSPLIFVLLGIGFGAFRYRTAKSGAILIGFVILVLYWTLQTMGTAALLRGTLSPFLAMQIPNGVMLILGLIGFRKSSW